MRTRHRGPIAIHCGQTAATNEQVDRLLSAVAPSVAVAATLATSAQYAGKVLGTVDIVACLPIRDSMDPDTDGDYIITDTLHNDRPTVGLAFRGDESVGVLSQVPLGDSTPGRWAWILVNPQPLEHPVRARGMQGIWEWDQ
ncbi:MAG: hypothetical protein AAGA37_19935 [Actinomycetota bacterium]